MAARGRRSHRAAGRRDRHRFDRHAVDPGRRRAGGRADRLPAHAQLQHAGPQHVRSILQFMAEIKATYADVWERVRRHPGGMPLPVPTQRFDEVDEDEARRRYEAAWAARRRDGAAAVQRPADQRAVERVLRRLLPRQDPQHGARSGDGGEARAEGLPDRRQTAGARHRLLRDVQQAQRPPRRHQARRRSRRSPRRAFVPAAWTTTRRDRVRDGVRRLHAARSCGSTSAAATAFGSPTVGRTDRPPISGWASPDSRTC